MWPGNREYYLGVIEEVQAAMVVVAAIEATCSVALRYTVSRMQNLPLSPGQ
jgi:hypothetical protein